MNIVASLQQKLKNEIKNAVLKANLAEETQIPSIILETPKDKAHGDYSTNIAMQLARVAKKAPRQIAEEIINHINGSEVYVEKMEIAGPGFINFYMDNHYLTELISTILDSGDQYGKTNFGQQEKIQVEFVSANPTGDLHLGHARGAAVGDSLSNVLAAAGYDVTREYYINDAGNQIHNLALSVEARYFQALGHEKEMPADGYYGEDIIQIGKTLAAAHGDKYVHASEEERYQFFRSYGLKYEMEKLKVDLENFRVPFDVWYSETSLYENGKIDEALKVLRENGHIYEQDGAVWLRTTPFGDDKDRVLKKQDGSYTYLTPDIAYHKDKFERGFSKVINIWGADHHGYIPRMKAAMEALGFDPNNLEVEIIQLVHLYKNGEKMKMSKRTGKAVTMRELVEEVGLDAVRYFFAMRSADTHLDFDLDLAVSQSNENPVYYAQYAHARICSILRQSEEQGISFTNHEDLSLIGEEKEFELLKKLGEFPQAIVEAAVKRTPHRITNYIHDLASTFHSFYNAVKVLDQEQMELSKVRLALVKSVQITLRNALSLIGVHAPEKM
ncbi:arginine--tRNA ligase [Caldibacillus lycopersici]|uniref:Arginine--tRNA ligase n=1 Tax=Perspicuibacillus lycopersici TaxID=1325689 RepID=A0AAE3IRV7_9BACI|nr:arginine--tRNA ligase [Perspicuibacillus lycopersici]MCU9613336.1 arginine--tRNA ligase [Perspicuibacillus lycopersici]